LVYIYIDNDGCSLLGSSALFTIQFGSDIFLA